MPRKIRQLKADLRRMGAYRARVRGDHETWKHPLVKDFYVELSGGDSDDADHYQERDIKKLQRLVDDAKRQQP